MSRRRELEQHRHRLDETREIMSSMKALAFMETRKLTTFIDAQRAVVDHIHRVAEDFLNFYPDSLHQAPQPKQVYLLLGSERGFCGNFNEALPAALHLEQAKEAATGQQGASIIAVGNKLCGLLATDPLLVKQSALNPLDGVSVVEDIENTLIEIVDTLKRLQAQNTGLALRILYHDPDRQEIISTQVLPPFESQRQRNPAFTQPPQLNLAPEKFCRDLIDRYLFATLHETLYLSLMAENQRRVSHLESAVQQLDDKADELLRRSNTLRQEEITEEIEIILLSAANLEPPRKPSSVRQKIIPA
ncbi:MAG: F0F1 ATP synthase subunit gamma [Gammaproteobacteria bacterium]|nr:F0F1 ATP synthase subunit gamma [Gammaproteobacteria bacterium]MBQ0838796.1 F0F1 ATP synthase subunit gamma [Gammaproteobacteria bacterium]